MSKFAVGSLSFIFFFFFLLFPPLSRGLTPLHLPSHKNKKKNFQDLEEELELDRKRVSEAEGVVKRAEEELAVAKERLLLQEDELQSRAGTASPPLTLTCLLSLWNQLSSARFHDSL